MTSENEKRHVSDEPERQEQTNAEPQGVEASGAADQTSASAQVPDEGRPDDGGDSPEHRDPVMDLPEIPDPAPVAEPVAQAEAANPEPQKKRSRSLWKMLAAAVALVAMGAGVGSATTWVLAQNYLQSQPPMGYEWRDSANVAPVVQSPFEGESVIPEIVRRVAPSVVKIEVLTRRGWSVGEGTGSGFVVDTRGYILTNYHVIDNADRIRVKFIDGTVLPAELVGQDPYKDLALIKVDPGEKRLVAAVLGDSDQVQVGELAIAIGAPFGQEWTVTAGIVSGLNRDIEEEVLIPGAIQTDAAINPGNSGGPLLNGRGEVIGINTAIEGPVRGSVGIGFAVPINAAKDILPTLMTGGDVEYAYLGVYLDTLTPAIAGRIGVDVTEGAIIVDVLPDTPAEEAGLRPAGFDRRNNLVFADVVIAVDGKPIKDADDLVRYVQSRRVGDTITLTVVRGSTRLELKATLTKRPDLGKN